MLLEETSELSRIHIARVIHLFEVEEDMIVVDGFEFLCFFSLYDSEYHPFEWELSVFFDLFLSCEKVAHDIIIVFLFPDTFDDGEDWIEYLIEPSF